MWCYDVSISIALYIYFRCIGPGVAVRVILPYRIARVLGCWLMQMIHIDTKRTSKSLAHKTTRRDRRLQPDALEKLPQCQTAWHQFNFCPCPPHVPGSVITSQLTKPRHLASRISGHWFQAKLQPDGGKATYEQQWTGLNRDEQGIFFVVCVESFFNF